MAKKPKRQYATSIRADLHIESPARFGPSRFSAAPRLAMDYLDKMSDPDRRLRGIAFVGPSGSGKRVLAETAKRYLYPTRSAVLTPAEFCDLPKLFHLTESLSDDDLLVLLDFDAAPEPARCAIMQHLLGKTTDPPPQDFLTAFRLRAAGRWGARAPTNRGQPFLPPCCGKFGVFLTATAPTPELLQTIGDQFRAIYLDRDELGVHCGLRMACIAHSIKMEPEALKPLAAFVHAQQGDLFDLTVECLQSLVRTSGTSVMTASDVSTIIKNLRADTHTRCLDPELQQVLDEEDRIE
ncbi:MAG: hypothetical protein O2855_04390 [Planctomycetota bacterium]|nr:hypothetical protein [Planctomycetota bacterium]